MEFCSRLVLIAVAMVSTNFAAAADSPFNGKDTSGWKLKGDSAKSKWTVGSAKIDEKAPSKLIVEKSGSELINAEGGGVDIISEEKYGDATIELEVMAPKGSNSGVYLMGEYEVQVFDSFGKEKLGQGDMGAIYSAAAPPINATKAPGEWQKFVIQYEAPKFDSVGKKTANAKVLKVELNGKMLHENVELKGPTPGGVTGKEAATGPIMFQGDHGAVAYRNIKVTAKK